MYVSSKRAIEKGNVKRSFKSQGSLVEITGCTYVTLHGFTSQMLYFMTLGHPTATLPDSITTGGLLKDGAGNVSFQLWRPMLCQRI